MTRWLTARRDPSHARAGWLVAAGALLGPPLTLALLRLFPVLDVAFGTVEMHLVVVSAISACALAVAVAAAIAVRRTGEGALAVLAVGCLAVGVFMLAHGLTTPGTFGRPDNLWVARFPILAVAAFAACLALAATRSDGWLLATTSRMPGVLVLVSGTLLVSGGGAAVIWPDAGIGGHPIANEDALLSTLEGLSAAALIGVGLIHWRRWVLGSDRFQLALVVAAWLGVGALMSLELGRMWHLAWWDYHVLLLSGFGAAVYAIVLASRRNEAVEQVLGSAFTADPLEHISRGYSEVLRALVAAVEARDAYTHGHSRRVAEWSVRIGQRLGLRTRQLRILAEGAYLHDVGKIGIPDEILNKPGRLTAEERAWIEAHPEVGVDIASQAPSLAPALAMIRHHHERYDGRGYPDRLAGSAIPLLARIVAVADVWDALTSDRAYRSAWSSSRALAHIVAGRGTHFDPECLDAFVGLLAERGISPDPSRGQPDVAAAPASACHQHVAS